MSRPLTLLAVMGLAGVVTMLTVAPAHAHRRNRDKVVVETRGRVLVPEVHEVTHLHPVVVPTVVRETHNLLGIIRTTHHHVVNEVVYVPETHRKVHLHSAPAVRTRVRDTTVAVGRGRTRGCR